MRRYNAMAIIMYIVGVIILAVGTYEAYLLADTVSGLVSNGLDMAVFMKYESIVFPIGMLFFGLGELIQLLFEIRNKPQ